MTDTPLVVDKIKSRPVLVLESTPYRVVAVHCHRKSNSDLLDRMAYVLEVLLEFKFRRVHADHHQSLVSVLLCPGSYVGQRAPPVDAGVGPKLDQHDLAAQL